MSMLVKLLAVFAMSILGRPIAILNNLGDFLPGARSRLAKPAAAKPDQKAWEQRIEASLNDVRLGLNHETVTNGDCGVDAILIGLELIENPNEKIKMLMKIKPRAERLSAMRRLQVKWLKKNATHEIVPEVSVQSWVTMDGRYDSMDKYIEAMRLPGVWVDTPMLYAASAWWEVQIVCYVGEAPQLLAASSVVGRKLPVVCMANFSNIHFYAVRVLSQDEVPISNAPGPQSAIVASQRVDEEDDDVDAFASCVLPAARPKDRTLLELASTLVGWDPFGDTHDAGLIKLLDNLTKADTMDASSGTFVVLRTREAIKLYEWEEAFKISTNSAPTMSKS